MTVPAKTRRCVQIFHCCLLFVCSLSAAFSANAYNRLDAIQALQQVQTNWPGAELSVWINDLKGDSDPGVLVGQSVRFSMESAAASYFLLTLVDSKGETTLIAGDTAAQRLDFPDRGSEEVLEQGPPVGSQTVFVFASDSQFRLEELGVTADEPIVTLPKGIASIERMVSVLSRHSNSKALAMAPRYTYFVDDPNNQISTRGIKKAMRKQMVEMEPVEKPKKDPVVVASKEIEPKEPVKVEPVAAAEPVTQDDPLPISSPPTGIASSALSLDIKFQYNSAELGESGMAQLDALGSVLLSLLEADTLPKISLEGHTDDTGSADYNMGLSDNRAKSARAYLIDSYGLPGDSIDAYGMGESSPMVKNVDKASRAKNRRVELRVLR